mgnify:FL=1
MVEFKNKKILVYGFGRSGKSCLNYLKKDNIVKIYDDKLKKLPKKFKISRLRLKKTIFDFIVLSPGINKDVCNLKKFLLINKSKIISDLDIFYFKNIQNLKICITGTNGKSTTSKIIHKILKNAGIDARLVGNIGQPILNEKKITKETVFVVEISSYQIEYSKYFKSDIAAILNIFPDHLDRHKTFSNYRKIKFKLLKNLHPGGTGLIEKNIFSNKDIKQKRTKTKIIKINSSSKNKIIDKNKTISNDMVQNFNFAIYISKLLKIEKKIIKKTINNFKGLPFRQEIIYQNKKVMIMNDSKSTSFSSSLNILKSFKNIHWILGGLAKKGDKLNLPDKFQKNIKYYIYGRDRYLFIKQLNYKNNIYNFKNLNDALKKTIINCLNQKNLQNIIFSPAAASFDQFKNFEDRGIYFNKLVKKLNLIKRINVKK